MTKPRVLLFGRTGQLARALIDDAPESFELDVFGRPEVDLANAGDVERAALDARADLIVNAAAYTQVDLAETEERLALRINADAPAAMARAQAQHGGALIHVSTDYVFDGRKQGAYTEGDELAPINAYGRTKAAGERAVAEALASHVILRTAWVYSEHGRNFVTTMLRLSETQETVSVVDDQRGGPTAAHDLAGAIWRVADAVQAGEGAWGVFHYCGQGEASWADLADAVFELSEPWTRRRPEVWRIATSAYPTPAPRPMNSVLDCARIGKAYGIESRPWRASLAETLARLNARKRGAR